MQRQSNYEGIISFHNAWHHLMNEDNTAFRFQVEGQLLTKPWDALIAEAFRSLIRSSDGKTAIAVDNALGEDRQDQLLSIASSGHLTNVDLLWRPVAITLDFLDRENDSGLKEGMKILVIDAESTLPEATILELRLVDGFLVPVRKFYRDEDTLSFSLSTGSATEALAMMLMNQDSEKARILQSGEFLEDFAHYRDGGPVQSTWLRYNQRFEPFDFSTSLAELMIRDDSYRGLVTECRNKADECMVDVILWHGWPLRCRSDLDKPNEYVRPADSVAHGANVYASRIDNGLPSFLEVLPGLEIYSTNHQTNKPEFYTIIEEKEYPGGQDVKIDPINDFDVEKGIDSLPVILRRTDWDSIRKVEFSDLPVKDENTPITITGELVPGQGRLKLRLSSRTVQEYLFGDQLHIDINWDTMDDFEMPEQSCEKYAPDAYPILGRVFDEDDPDIRTALRAAVNTGSIDAIVNYRGHQVSFKKLLEPWGYHWPWIGSRDRKPTCGQSTRGIFSSGYQEDGEIDKLASDLSLIIEKENTRSRHKFLNYMFIYAPETFKKELRAIFKTPINKLNPRDINQNTIYGVGRVFNQADDVNLFLQFIVDSCDDDSWPAYPDNTYTKIYFWSVFRCLCYYPNASRANSDLANKICLLICNYMQKGNPNATEKKYCLCALLFLTRIREHCDEFMDPRGDLADRIVKVVNKYSSGVRFPPAMGISGNDGDNLSQFTLRFINKEVTDNDFLRLSGLVTSA